MLTEAPAFVGGFVFFLVWLLLWLPIAVPLAIALKWRPPAPITMAQKLPLLASLYLLAPLVLWGIAAIKGENFGNYGLPWKASILVSLGTGFILGVLGLGMMFAVQIALRWVEWNTPRLTPDKTDKGTAVGNLWGILLSTLLLGVWVSLTEELVFRGFLVNQLQQEYSPWVAAAIASFVFALLHLVWEGVENLPQLPGLWLMGMVLVLARWVDGGNLGLAWGLHAGWIWAIASLDATQAIVYTHRGPAWLVGLGDKPLAGLMVILFLLVTGSVLGIKAL